MICFILSMWDCWTKTDSLQARHLALACKFISLHWDGRIEQGPYKGVEGVCEFVWMKRGVKSGGGGPWWGLAWIGVYRQGGGRVRQGRSRGGRVREKEETRQKFAIMSVEEGAGGWCVEERVFSGWWRSGREPGRTSVSLNRDICQRGPLVCVCICVCVCANVCVCD